MEGKITFETLEEVAEFLKAFTGCTALFTVRKHGKDWILQFTGGF
jgi:Holliday junction resolvase